MLSSPTIISQFEPDLQSLFEQLEAASSLSRIVLLAVQLARRLAVRIIAAVLQRRAELPTNWPLCPVCGRRLRSKGFVKRQVLTLVGVVCFRRRVGRCPQGCQIGQIAPLDQELGLAPHQQTSRELQQAACALAVFVPFATAATLLHQLLGIGIGGTTLWQWVQAAGRLAQEQLEAELKQLAQGVEPALEAAAAALEQLPLLVGADGVMVPFRPQGGQPRGKTRWREVKVGILARLASGCNRAGQVLTRLRQRRLVAVLGEVEQLEERLWLEALRQSLRHSPVVVWLSDGARGLWGLYRRKFAPCALGILDFYHATQHLWQAASAWLDGRRKRAREWFVTVRHRLRHGEEEAVLAELAAVAQREGLGRKARAAVQKVFNYLDTHRQHINYDRFKELGLPLGSGMVESACKWLIQQRFKGVGMRWSEDGFNHLLHLRLAWVNGRFDDLFSVPIVPHSPKQ